MHFSLPGFEPAPQLPCSKSREWVTYSKLNKGCSGLMSLAGTEYQESRHNNQESSLDSQVNTQFLRIDWAINP